MKEGFSHPQEPHPCARDPSRSWEMLRRRHPGQRVQGAAPDTPSASHSPCPDPKPETSAGCLSPLPQGTSPGVTGVALVPAVSGSPPSRCLLCGLRIGGIINLSLGANALSV